MKIIAADDERLALEFLVSTLKETLPKAEIRAFTKPSEVIECARKQKCDIAFLDIQMRSASGLEIAKKLKECQPHINIIFVTGYDEYTGEAMQMHASGYIQKPITPEKLRRELDDLRYPVRMERLGKKLTVRCFGSFEVYAQDGSSVHFERAKAKECLAYLISKQGTECNVREIAGILFEDAPYDRKHANYTQKILASMIKSLKQAGAAEIVKKKYNAISILPEMIDCDYFRFCQGDSTAVNAYRGEFMSQYSWAEFMTAYIERKIQ